MKTTFILILVVLQLAVHAQNKPFESHPGQLGNKAFAHWIGSASGSGEGIFYFRKNIQLESLPDRFIIHISADNRYRLYVNGEEVSWGPAVGDMNNWNYESIDIAPFLKKGSNIIAAQVWNRGRLAGARQISSQTAFIPGPGSSRTITIQPGRLPESWFRETTTV